MYITLPQASPWEKMVSFLSKSTTFRATPAESRKACASNSAPFVFFGFLVAFIMLRLVISSIRSAPTAWPDARLGFPAPTGTLRRIDLRWNERATSQTAYMSVFFTVPHSILEHDLCTEDVHKSTVICSEPF